MARFEKHSILEDSHSAWFAIYHTISPSIKQTSALYYIPEVHRR